MKKLILACCALFVLGGGLAAGGWAAGGELYSSYYSGAFHSLRETLHIPHWREWWDEDGVRHSGFFHGALDEIQDEVRGHIDNAPEEGRPDSDTSLYPSGRAGYTVFYGKSDTLLQELNLSVDGNSGSVLVKAGTDYTVSGGATVLTDHFDGEAWSLALFCREGEQVTVTLPALAMLRSVGIHSQGCSLDFNGSIAASEIDIELADGTLSCGELFASGALDLSIGSGGVYAERLSAAELDIEVESGDLDCESLAANDTLDLTIESGTASVDLLSAPVIEAEVGTGSLDAGVAVSDHFGYQAVASAGSVYLNGTEIAGDMAGAHRAFQKGSAPMLRLNVAGGYIELATDPSDVSATRHTASFPS